MESPDAASSIEREATSPVARSTTKRVRLKSASGKFS
jgi:hypothetical protein